MLNIFSCIFWPSVCLLWRFVCLDLLPIFWWGFLLFWYGAVGGVYKFWRLIPCPLNICTYFLPSCGLSFFFFFFHFLGRSHGIWRFTGWGSNWSHSHRPTPEPQQHRIRATSATYTTPHGNARSLTHWARAGIKPTISWFLVGFVNHSAMTGTPNLQNL